MAGCPDFALLMMDVGDRVARSTKLAGSGLPKHFQEKPEVLLENYHPEVSIKSGMSGLMLWFLTKLYGKSGFKL